MPLFNEIDRELEILQLWMSYTPEKRREQLASMHKIIRNPPSNPHFNLAKFQSVVAMLEDWHEEIEA